MTLSLFGHNIKPNILKSSQVKYEKKKKCNFDDFGVRSQYVGHG